MEEITLTEQNYHSIEARKLYMGYSQFKDFLDCPKKALAKINGELEEKSTDALLFGSYVDAYFSGTLNDFILEHSEMFNSKTGQLKTQFANVQTVIDAIENDELLNKMLQGEHQVIMTGIIAGVPFKIKVDSLFRDKYIVDQKVMRDMKPVWIERDGRNVKVNFVEAFRYDLEGAIYQEIVRQNTGKRLPFILAVTTKEDVPSKALLKIDQEDLDAALQEVEELAPTFNAMKQGKLEPTGCGECEVCRKDKKVTGIFSYHTCDPYTNEDF